MFLQDYLWLDIETDNDSAICPHNLLFQGEASGVKGSRSVLWKECWIQLFIGVNDNVWHSVENVRVTASADPTEGSRWGVLIFLESRNPWLCDPVAGSLTGTSAMTQSWTQQDPLEDQGRIFLETFYLVSELDDLMKYRFGQPKLNSL